MDFRTHVKIEPFSGLIDHSMHGLSMGSCFAVGIAEKLRQAKFRITSNPFGILYNPFSIADAIETLASGKRFSGADLTQCNDLWCSFSFHGDFSSASAGEALAGMNRAADEGGEALLKADYLLLTFGTAWVYELKSDGRVVANCHKFPAAAFDRRRLSVAEITARYGTLFDTVLKGKTIILTVSPVRHLKDGFAENSLSKATLLLAAAELSAKYPNVEYFPAFEIVNDELRDYRFYKADMIHPSDVAVDYIWEHFCSAAVSPEAVALTKEIERITAAASHRPFNPDTESHRKFCRTMLGKSMELQSAHPELDLGAEIEYFKNGSADG